MLVRLEPTHAGRRLVALLGVDWLRRRVLARNTMSGSAAGRTTPLPDEWVRLPPKQPFGIFSEL